MSKRKKIKSSQCQQEVLTSYFNKNASRSNVSGNEDEGKRKEAENDKGGGSRFRECPMCFKGIPKFDLQRHAEYCQGDKNITLVSGSDARCGGINSTEPSLKFNEEPLPGLFIYENFISEKEEQDIITALDNEVSNPWKLCSFNGIHLGKRWGVHCNLRDRRVDTQHHPLPSFMQNIIMPKLLSLQPMIGCTPNESNAIEYRKKDRHYLEAHVDDRQLSKQPIANLSLAGDCIMTFRNERLNNKTQKNAPVKVLLKRRTLQILTGKARYDYSHGIERDDILSARRIPLTMRESPLTKTARINFKKIS